MKKHLFLILIVLLLAVNACTSQATSPQGTSNTSSAEQPAATSSSGRNEVAIALDTSYENAASVPMQLLAGTFSLAGTDQAITKEQAAILLPLWTEYQTLAMNMGPRADQSSSGDSQSQIDNLVSQIQSAMTADQIKAISEMKITQETVLALMQEQGISMGVPPIGSPGTGGPQSGEQPQGTLPAPPDGSPPSNPPAAPPSGGLGAPPLGDAGATLTGGMVPPEVITALIQSLAEINGIEISPVTDSAQRKAAPMQPPSGAGSSVNLSITAVYEQDGGSETLSGQTYSATEQDQSAVYVKNAGMLNLDDAAINSSGNTSSQDNSSFHGLNAAVLATTGSTITLSNSSISTSGTGANGAFATDSGSSVNLTDVTITATGDGGHGVMATNGGSMTLVNVDMNTAGKNSGAIATDRGGGTIQATGGAVTTSGQDSPAIYSTGNISVSGGTLSASGAEAAVIEGANSITLTDSSLSTSKEKWGIMIYQSMSGDAEGTQGTFTMTGGKLEYSPTNGPLFYVTNTTGVITLKSVEISSGSGSLVEAEAGNWGNAGTNGGTVIFTADSQILKGDLSADGISSIDLTLQNGSSLGGAINAENTAKAVNLTLDASSTWNVTSDSFLTCLADTGGISGSSITNITGNGHTVYYNSSECPALGGQTYTLSGGGYLKPLS